MSDYALSGDHGDQLSMDQDVPVAGETYLNRGTRTIGTVTRVREDRRVWVTVRRHDSETDMTLENFRAYWDRCRPDGRLL